MASNVASVEYNGSGKPASLMAGSLSPEILRAWERSCVQYFKVKNIANVDKVRMVSYELKDPRMEAWIIANETHIEGLSFEDFMEELRDLWLEDGWEDVLRRRILSMRQGSKPFKDWSIEIQSLNTILVGWVSALTNAAIRDHLHVNMSEELSLRVRSFLAVPPVNIDAWITAVSKLDESLCRKRTQALVAATTAIRLDRAQRNKDRDTRNVAAQPARNSNTASSSEPTRGRVPKITESEQALLNAHEGCSKCRQFYVNHRAGNCPNGFPVATGYKTKTEADVKSALAAKTITPGCRNAIAHVGPSASIEETDDSVTWAHVCPRYWRGTLRVRSSIPLPTP
jgi:hypothetical protein